MSMLLRRRLMTDDGGSPPTPTGTYIYRKLDVPYEEFDTGVKLADTDKSFTILTEMSFPGAEISGNNWNGVPSRALYGIGTFNVSAQTAAQFVSGGNYIRLIYYTKETYKYANKDSAPFFSNDRRHRFAHWHVSNSGAAGANLDGYAELSVTNGTYVASDDTLVVASTENRLIVHALYIYDKVLTSDEIDAFITDGIIP